MSAPRLCTLLLVLACLAGCGAPPEAATGAVHVSLSLPLAVPGDVAHVTVTVSGADMAPMSTTLSPSQGAWGGILGKLPAGEHRVFHARAFNASYTLRYEARVEDVIVLADTTGLVVLALRDVIAPAPFANEAPIVDSLVATPVSVRPGGQVSLSVNARDPNAGDTVSYAWTAPAGSFSTPTRSSTSWSAPSVQGPVRLSLRVSDSRGAALTVNVPVSVSAGTGAQEVRVDFNTAPRMEGFTSTQSALTVGQGTVLTVAASDPDGDGLSYQWSATCAGGFTGGDSPRATFVPSAVPAAACNNCQITVAVTDGRGGRNQGSTSLCVSGTPVPRPPASWKPTGSMAVARMSPTATLLPDGKVLVLAGNSSSQSRATTELYDPTTGTWSTTGAMVLPRYDRKPTVLLQTGRVLVVGGDGSAADVRAELYNPATGTWSETGSLNVLHTVYTLTLLLDGRVLLSGNHGTSAGTAEVYTPARGTWSRTYDMLDARGDHSATRLSNGKVLVAGGFNTRGMLATAELYDPATGYWSATGALSIAHHAHTAVLLHTGKVLLAGGYSGPGSGALATAELYDPARGTWSPTGSMSTPRAAHAMVLLADGKVLVVGGAKGDSSTAELYDPATGTWSPTASMSTGRTYPSLTRLRDGRVLIQGGYDASGTDLSTAEVYDPGT